MKEKIGVDIHEANKKLQKEEWLVVDIRDEVSFKEGHIKGAQLLNNSNLQKFINTTEKSANILCYCYHGISSKDAVMFLKKKGFRNVNNLEGGFEAWKESYSYDVEGQ